jgi:outer membrane lipoprotein-sorting protein
MRRFAFLACFAALAFVFVSGCNKHAKADAAQALQQSFQTAEPEVKQAIESVNSSLKT